MFQRSHSLHLLVGNHPAGLDSDSNAGGLDYNAAQQRGEVGPPAGAAEPPVAGVDQGRLCPHEESWLSCFKMTQRSPCETGRQPKLLRGNQDVRRAAAHESPHYVERTASTSIHTIQYNTFSAQQGNIVVR